MIAYNKTWLDNLAITDTIKTAYEQKHISKEEKEKFDALYPVGFYTPNYFIRIGLFILTVIIAAFSLGLLCLISLDHLENNFKGCLLFIALASYAALEFFVQSKHHYRSGVDDALLYITGISIVGSCNLFADLSYLQNAWLIFILASYFVVRFADTLMSFAAILALLAIIFFTYIKLDEVAKATMPFLLMIISATIYFIIRKISALKKFRHYKECGIIIEILSLLSFYAVANYFVVREVSNEMFNMNLKDGESIPFAWFFWILTAIIPLIYIVRGLQKKNVLILRTGLLLIAAIVCTVRYYHAVMPLEVAMLAGGAIFIVLAYTLTKYLATPKNGFTSAEAKNTSIAGKLNLEALLIAQTFGDGSQAAPDTKFGGGSFGGGGASGDY